MFKSFFFFYYSVVYFLSFNNFFLIMLRSMKSLFSPYILYHIWLSSSPSCLFTIISFINHFSFGLRLVGAYPIISNTLFVDVNREEILQGISYLKLKYRNIWLKIKLCFKHIKNMGLNPTYLRNGYYIPVWLLWKIWSFCPRPSAAFINQILQNLNLKLLLPWILSK